MSTNEFEKSIKVTPATHKKLMSEKVMHGYKSIDELIEKRVFNNAMPEAAKPEPVQQENKEQIAEEFVIE